MIEPIIRSASGMPIERADDWICICGNTTASDGFYPCNREGFEVEPTPLAWIDDLYCCARCGRIIDGVTGLQRGQRGEPEPLLPGTKVYVAPEDLTDDDGFRDIGTIIRALPDGRYEVQDREEEHGLIYEVGAAQITPISRKPHG